MLVDSHCHLGSQRSLDTYIFVCKVIDLIGLHIQHAHNPAAGNHWHR